MSELWFPADRVAAALGESPDLSKWPALVRRYYELREGRQKWVSLRVVDEFFTRLELLHLFRLSPEDGGFSDIYVDGVQYGKPTGFNPRRIYETDAERVEAFRRNWRRSKARARLREQQERAA